MAYISKINLPDNNTYKILSNFYAVCDTAADIAAKQVTINGFILQTGVTVIIKFNANWEKTEFDLGELVKECERNLQIEMELFILLYKLMTLELNIFVNMEVLMRVKMIQLQVGKLDL